MTSKNGFLAAIGRPTGLYGLCLAACFAPGQVHACNMTGVPVSPDVDCPDTMVPGPPGSHIIGITDEVDPLPAPPVTPPAQTSRPVALRGATDTGLQAELERLVATPAMARAVREKRFSAALVDVTDVQDPRLAMVNGDVMIYAASLPKIAILLGVFDRAEAGDFALDEQTLTQATRMIRNSSNPAATAMYFKVGPKKLSQVLRSEKYRLYNPEWGGGLWVGKPYARQDTWQRDPIANLSHGATAFQVARFFYLLEAGRLVSPAASQQMKKILGKPAIHHKFVKGLSQARPGTRIFRKSGTWRTYHADAGIVERDGRRYIAVMIANDPAGSQWLSKLIVDFDDLIHGSGTTRLSRTGP